jgi:hypothetical protein
MEKSRKPKQLKQGSEIPAENILEKSSKNAVCDNIWSPLEIVIGLNK